MLKRTKGADVNEKCSELRSTPLHYAAMNEARGDGLIDFFLEKGCDIDKINAHCNEAIDYVLRVGNFKLAMRMHKLSQERKFGAVTIGRILQSAVIKKSLDFAKFVYNNNRNEMSSEEPSSYLSILEDACHNGDLEMFKWLLEEVINVNQFEDTDWKNRILESIAWNRTNETSEIIQYLSSKFQFTADQQSEACRCAFLHKVLNHEIHDVFCAKNGEALFKEFADTKIKIRGQNLLQLCVSVNHLDAAKIVHGKDAELINETDEDGATILQLAAQFGSVEMCQWLIAQGQDLCALNEKTRANFLYYATQNSSNGGDIIKTFGQHFRGYVNQPDLHDHTLLHLSMLNDGKYRKFDSRVAEALLELGADLSVKRNGNNFLHFCIVNRMLDSAMFVDAKDRNMFTQRGEGGKTTLHIAADNFDKDICAWLVVSKGAHPRDLTVGGKTVLEATRSVEAKLFLLSLTTYQESYDFYRPARRLLKLATSVMATLQAEIAHR
ncbi:Hypothetical predicted protein [Cloeon dipterum]|uniref:Uncharacterized protein n=2 Tax=Cloeon dipterum TaxID=197152 RepID=A0A8S1DEQ6_9INSE|nr:Hypothetical predicted protein [Cloeon dipterum]